MALSVGTEVTPVATATMNAAPLNHYVDVGEDWKEVSVGGTSPASQLLPMALVNPCAVPPAPATPIQNHTEEAPTSLL